MWDGQRWCGENRYCNRQTHPTQFGQSTSAHNPAGRANRAPRRRRATKTSRRRATAILATPHVHQLRRVPAGSAPDGGAGATVLQLPPKTAGSASGASHSIPCPARHNPGAAHRQIPPGSCHARPCEHRRSRSEPRLAADTIPAPAGNPTTPIRVTCLAQRLHIASHHRSEAIASRSAQHVVAQVGRSNHSLRPGCDASFRDSGTRSFRRHSGGVPRGPSSTANASPFVGLDGGPNLMAYRVSVLTH